VNFLFFSFFLFQIQQVRGHSNRTDNKLFSRAADATFWEGTDAHFVTYILIHNLEGWHVWSIQMPEDSLGNAGEMFYGPLYGGTLN
jgi:hypothetical protein